MVVKKEVSISQSQVMRKTIAQQLEEKKQLEDELTEIKQQKKSAVSKRINQLEKQLEQANESITKLQTTLERDGTDDYWDEDDGI